jgi:hypothetical protein
VDGYNCMSNYCKIETGCFGNSKDSNCHTSDDCDIGLYCRKSINWPYQTTCTSLRGEYEECDNDFECKIHQYCWYNSKVQKVAGKKTCMPIYAKADGDVLGWSSSSSKEPTE